MVAERVVMMMTMVMVTVTVTVTLTVVKVCSGIIARKCVTGSISKPARFKKLVNFLMPVPMILFESILWEVMLFKTRQKVSKTE